MDSREKELIFDAALDYRNRWDRAAPILIRNKLGHKAEAMENIITRLGLWDEYVDYGLDKNEQARC